MNDIQPWERVIIQKVCMLPWGWPKGSTTAHVQIPEDSTGIVKETSTGAGDPYVLILDKPVEWIAHSNDKDGKYRLVRKQVTEITVENQYVFRFGDERTVKGRSYWKLLSIRQRVALIEAHGGFSEKHADQIYDHLTPSLKEIANEAAITPGGIIKLERLFEIGVLDGNAYDNKTLKAYSWQYHMDYRG